jgi:hypothetical protein
MGEQSLNWLDVLNLAISDALAKDVDIDPEIVEKYRALETQLQEAMASLQPIQEKDSIPPILNGNEVMQILNIKPGKWMSEIMEFVRELRDENPNITKEEATERLKQQFGHLSPDAPKTAQKEKEDEPASTCPMHLFRQKQKEVTKLRKEKKYYEVLTVLKQLCEDYGDDENVIRLISINMLPLLIRDEKFRDNTLLQHIFSKAEENFFDPVICSFVLGILILIETATEDNILDEIGLRMSKMAPGTLRTVLEMLPEKVERPHVKKALLETINR